MKKAAVVYASDDNYAMQLGISLISLLQSNPNMEAEVFIVSLRISEKNINSLVSIGNSFDVPIHMIEISSVSNLTNVVFSLRNVISEGAYIRLFLSELLPDYIERVLWLDSDTLIMEPISRLLKMNLDENYCAMALDAGNTFKLLNGFKRDEKYFNSGVIVIDMQKWKDIVYPIIREEIIKRKGKSIDEDQSYINAACKGKVVTLDPRYNMVHAYYRACDDFNGFLKNYYITETETYSKDTLMDAKKNAAIIHFTNFSDSRPWFVRCNHIMKERWLQIKEESPWKDSPLEDNSSLKIQNKKKQAVMHMIYTSPFRKVFVRMRYGLWI